MNCSLIFITFILLFDSVISFSRFTKFRESFKSTLRVCGQSESLRKCACSCIEKCQNKDNPNFCPKDEPITTKCFCKKGFYRNSVGKCVTSKECHSFAKIVHGVIKCAQNEFYGQCGNLCKNSCEGYIKQTCSQKSCDNGCFCGRGLFRNKQDQCVPSNQCHSGSENKPICGENKIFVKCGNLCQNTCKNIIHRNSCPSKSCDDGCFCKLGFWKNDEGDCVRKDMCKLTTKIESDSDSTGTKVQDDVKGPDEIKVKDVITVLAVTIVTEETMKPIETTKEGLTEESIQTTEIIAGQQAIVEISETGAEMPIKPMISDSTETGIIEELAEWEKIDEDEKPIEPSKDGRLWTFNGNKWTIIDTLTTELGKSEGTTVPETTVSETIGSETTESETTESTTTEELAEWEKV